MDSSKVMLTRDPEVESALTRLLHELSSSDKCIICGDTNVASLRQARRHYKSQLQLFKKFFVLSSDSSKKLLPDFENGEETCGNCLSSVKHVWDLQQQIESLQKEIQEVLQKSRDLVQDKLGLKSENEDYNILIQDEMLNEDNNMESSEDSPSPRRKSLKRKLKAETVNHANTVDSDNDISDANIESEEDEQNEKEKPRKKRPPRKPRDKSKTISKPFKCLSCEIAFITELNLSKHVNSVHQGQPSIGCDHCDKHFYKELYLKLHRKKVHSISIKYSCSKCGKVLSSRKALKTHEIKVCKLEDSTNIKWNHCDLCDFKGARPIDLKMHSYTHSAAKSYPCSTCEKSFTNPKYAKYHQDYVCGPENKEKREKKIRAQPFSCIRCGKRFTTLEEKSQHFVNFPGHIKAKIRTKKAICEVCGLAVKTNLLNNHIKQVHDKVLNHFCPHCNKGFFRQCDCKKHVKLIHEKDADTSSPVKLLHMCEICGKSYTQKFGLAEHTQRVHLRVKKFQCDLCPFKFFKQKELADHRAYHDKKKITCDKCGLEVSSNYKLTIHRKCKPNCDKMKQTWKKKSKVNKCDVCNSEQTFASKSSLNKHIRDEHPGFWDWGENVRKDEGENVPDLVEEVEIS